MKTLTKTEELGILPAGLANFDDFDASSLSVDFIPSVNIRETETNYEMELSASGFKRGDFTVSTDDGNLMISASTSSRRREENEDYTRKEFSRTSFSRSFKLPENVLQNKITANYHGGLLKIRLKKADAEVSNQKKIKIS
ncbi:Hsp20/alpha crystallin family protein [Pedobacter sp. L105]|uniref:Hsp20/alpha crystallin family protein n=1 Tax=Pedobacter sp. L105 TaxID=1641871 RepID=UPI00131CA18F|nr:Hsp20/alpha crystallin family protein [Pedobacter sp. L105]